MTLTLSRRPSSAGFTLVELSIVLIIIGLIVGGVLAGNNLIRGAELRTIIKEKEQYQAAINVFKIKYNALPGDFAKANAYFAGTDGDGDGITWWQNNGAGNVHENLKAWQHLSLSGIIPGSYTGLASGVASIVGTNIPASKIGGGRTGWEFLTFNHSLHYGKNAHMLMLGANSSSNSDIADDEIMSPVEAQLLDAKFDDGVAYTGAIQIGNGDTVTGCTSNAWTAPSNYTTSTSILCLILFYGVGS